MKQGLATLSKTDRKTALGVLAQRAKRVREHEATNALVNGALAVGCGVGAAAIDHKFRTGDDSQARFGAYGGKFRPPVNGVLGLAAIAVGVAGAVMKKRWASHSMAVGIGFGIPAAYSATRDHLARQP